MFTLMALILAFTYAAGVSRNESRKQDVVVEAIATHLIKKAGQTHKMARAGAVTLIQRFGSALNLNIHFHMLFLDGVYIDTWGATRFRWVKGPTSAKITQLTQVIAGRVGRFLERQSLLEKRE
jgi:hypothetical protein